MLIEKGLLGRIVESLNSDDPRWRVVDVDKFGSVGLQAESNEYRFRLVADYFEDEDCWEVHWNDWLEYCDLLPLSVAVTGFLKRKGYSPTSYMYRAALAVFNKEM